MSRPTRERVSKLHTQTVLWNSFCSDCVNGNQDISTTCKSCPINGHLNEIGAWLTADMRNNKPKSLHERKSAKEGVTNFTQAEFDELTTKGLRNAEIAHLIGVPLHVFNRYKTKHGIRTRHKEVLKSE